MATSLNNSSVNLSLNDPAWLQWMASLMGGVSRQTYASTLPPDRFYCLLDELPLHLIPSSSRFLLNRREGCRHDGHEEPLFLNPDCILCSSGELPDELEGQRELVSGFALQGMIAWVRSPTASILLPFWLGPELEGTIKNLRWNEPVPSTVPRKQVDLLAAANILMPEGRIGQRGREEAVAGSFARASGSFREKDYAVLGSLIHPFHIAALRRYYRYLIRFGLIRLGDGQSPRRYAAHNEPVARFFHHQMASTLSAVAGKCLKPSYVYLASYLSGAELKKHTDREQCEFSITLCLDFSPEPILETPWPIRLDTPHGTVTVYQALGDGLAYRGTRLPHYRDALGEGQTSTSIFFHYVAADFAGSLR
jgi:hypothetical protein